MRLFENMTTSGQILGQPMNRENREKVDSFVNLIHGLLLNTQMTARELTACLMSEPYNIPLGDLNLIVTALNKLNDYNSITVTYRMNRSQLEVEVVLTGLPIEFRR